MVSAGAELHLGHGGFHQVGAGLVDRAEVADLGRAHIGVGLQLGLLEPLPLEQSRSLDPLPHFGAGLAGALAAELFEGYTGYVDVDVDAIQQRAGDSFLVALDHGDGTGTFFLRIAEITAWAGIETKVAFWRHLRS